MKETCKKTLVLLLALAVLLGALPIGLGTKAQAAEKLKPEVELDASGVTPEMARAYLEVVDGLIANGGYLDNIYYPGFAGGVLVDMDGDGVKELVALSIEKAYGMSMYSTSVWTYDDGAVSVGGYSFEAREQGDGENNSYKLVGVGDKVYLLDFTQTHRYELLRTDETYNYYELVRNSDGKLRLTHVVYAEESRALQGEDSYSLDYSDCDEETYRAEMKKYQGHSYDNLVDHRGILENGRGLRALLEEIAQDTPADNKTSLLKKLPYTGDLSACRLTGEMALAYADLLNSHHQYALRAALFDGGSGIPMLWVAYGDGWDSSMDALTGAYHDRVYTYADGQVVECKWMTTVLKTGENGIIAQKNISMASDHDSVFKLYRLNGGKIASAPFAEGQAGLNGGILNGEYVGQYYSVYDIYDMIEPGMEMLLNAESGLADMLFLDGTWQDGRVTAKTLEKYAALSGVRAPASSYLNSIDYIGDTSKCNMTPAMAKAYIHVLEELEILAAERGDDVFVSGTLIDVSGEGYPILAAGCYYQYGMGWVQLIHDSFGIWEYRDGKAVKYDFYQHIGDENALCIQNYEVIEVNGETMLWAQFCDVESFFFSASKGRLNLELHAWHDNDYYEEHPKGSGIDGKTYADGNEVFAALGITDRYRQGEFLAAITTGDASIRTEVTGDKLIAALRAYADASGAYTYPKAEDVDEAEIVEAIAKAVAEAVGGEITGIYKLADGVYYVIITVDGGEKGALVLGQKENGKVCWKVGETHDAPADQAKLDELLRGILSQSNLELDYSAINGSDLDKIMDSLQNKLDNMSGVAPNDPAKSELATYIENAISANCSASMSGSDNRMEFDKEKVADLAKQAQDAKKKFQGLLDENDIELNKTLTIIIRILWRDMDSGAPCQVTLDQELLSAMDDCSIQLLLGDARHYIQLSPANLQKLVNAYGVINVQLVMVEDGVYTINFLDKNGEIIDRIHVSVGFALPADTELSTIMVSWTGGSANWGGQYDPNSKAITFDASYSGQYEVLENSVSISDIGDLDEETQAAVAFLVSKGYMGLNGEAFDPGAPLTRYEFAQALVGMFFALDTSLAAGFPDVPKDSPYYSYVASGEHSHIIEGYDDGTFSGDKNITMEQMLALAARTLIEHKGYTEPDDAESYLGTFSDGNETSDWARAQVAMAIREGLVDLDGTLAPLSDVSRGDAALILYRLFLLLYEVPTVELELPPVTETVETPVAAETETKSGGAGTGAVIAGVGGVGVAAAAAWWFLKKRRV